MKKLFFCLLALCSVAQAAEPCYKADLSLEALTQCATQGDSIAQSNLGLKYLQGQGVTKDDAKAFEWFSKSADQGDLDAQNALGVIYEKGYGVTPDFKKAAQWYEKAAEQGHVGAQNNLSYLYAYGTGGVSMDFVLGYKWSALAVMRGYTNAIEIRDLLIKSMTPEQLAEGKKAVDEWLAAHSKK